MKRCILIFAFLSAPVAFASGGVHCKKVDAGKPPVTFEWGAGHVEGGGRISPYRLTIADRLILISDSRDPKHVKNWLSGGERIDVSEVGYWNGDDRIMVWLADDQVSKRLLILKVTKEKDETYKGTLSVEGIKGVKLANISLVCSVE